MLCFFGSFFLAFPSYSVFACLYERAGEACPEKECVQAQVSLILAFHLWKVEASAEGRLQDPCNFGIGSVRGLQLKLFSGFRVERHWNDSECDPETSPWHSAAWET